MTEQELAPVESWSTDLPAFAELIASLSDVDDADAAVDESEQTMDFGEVAERTMDLEEVTLSLAIELEVRQPEGAQPRVTGSTPTQWTETSVMPVFHRLSMRVARAVDA